MREFGVTGTSGTLFPSQSSMIPTYLTYWPLWRDLIPIPIIAAFLPLLGAYLSQKEATKSTRDVFRVFLILYALSVLGIVTGQLTGQSREPTVGAVVPAALSLVGGLTIFLVVAKSRQQQVAAASLVIVFSLNLLVGIFWGAKLRHDDANYKSQYSRLLTRTLAEHAVNLEKLVLEKEIQELRKEFNPPLSE